MVYLDVYDRIFEYLEDISIVDNVFEHSEKILGSLLDKIHENELHNDVIIECALYTYLHKNKFLIEFLSENLYSKLSKDEKKEFDLIKESKRFNLKFDKKEKTDKLDTKGLELYYFYFTDLDDSEQKTILSSTPLDELKFDFNARLVKHPREPDKYFIIGGIFNVKIFEMLSSFSSMKVFLDKIKSSSDF